MRRLGRAVRARAVVVLVAAATAAAVLVVATRTWVDAVVPAGLPGAGTVAVPGGSAAPVVPALALVALAAAGALTIAGRRARVVVLVLMAVAGLGAALAAVRVVTDPLAAARASLGAATGLVPGSVEDSGASVSATAWPPAAAVLGLVVVAIALTGLHARHRWDDDARFEQQPGTADTATGNRDVDPRVGWDALSRGDDPTRG